MEQQSDSSVAFLTITQILRKRSEKKFTVSSTGSKLRKGRRRDKEE
jgi:hypothetical protein